MARHVEIAHPELGCPKFVICHVCQKKIRRKDNFDRHVAEMHHSGPEMPRNARRRKK